jgi:hypothetical protein
MYPQLSIPSGSVNEPPCFIKPMNRMSSPPHHANASKGKLIDPAPAFSSSEHMSKDKAKKRKEKKNKVLIRTISSQLYIAQPSPIT